MHKQCVIIILAFVTGKEITAFEVCGTVSSSPVQEGQNAYLEYIPNPKYYHNGRKWLRTGNDNKRVILFDSTNRTSWMAKYSEVKKVKGYTMTIKDTTVLDEGRYAVQCLDLVYSYSYILNVTKAEPAPTLPYTHKTIAKENDETRVTQLWTSKRPSSSAVYRTDRLEDESASTVSYAHRSSTIEPDNAHVTRFTTSKLPYTTVVHGDRTDRQETIPSTHRSSSDGVEKDFVTRRQPPTTEENIDITNVHEEDDGEAIKQIPNQSTTQKDKEKISATEEEKIINTEELKLLIPITGSVVGIVVAVAVGTVCVTVRKKKRNEETQLKTPEMESCDKEGSRPDGRFAEEVRGPGGIQEQAQPSSSDARSDVLAQSSEPPEYASVIPKEKRACEAKQNTNKGNSLICDNTETDNQLVYAELDLQPASHNRPTTNRYETTEYVTIDFSRTETSQAETCLPEQSETTEYVSVDFSRSETSQADTGLSKQHDTTDNVDLSKK